MKRDVKRKTLKSPKSSKVSKLFGKEVTITWGDAWVDDALAMIVKDDAEETSPLIVKSTGWLVGESETGYVIARETSSIVGRYRGPQFIPKCNVIELKELK